MTNVRISDITVEQLIARLPAHTTLEDIQVVLTTLKPDALYSLDLIIEAIIKYTTQKPLITKGVDYINVRRDLFNRRVSIYRDLHKQYPNVLLYYIATRLLTIVNDFGDQTEKVEFELRTSKNEQGETTFHFGKINEAREAVDYLRITYRKSHNRLLLGENLNSIATGMVDALETLRFNIHIGIVKHCFQLFMASEFRILEVNSTDPLAFSFLLQGTRLSEGQTVAHVLLDADLRQFQ